MRLADYKIIDRYRGICLVNVAARGTIAICEKNNIPIPKTTKELDERLVSLPPITGDQAPYFLQDPGSRERFFHENGVNLEYHAYTTSQIDQLLSSHDSLPHEVDPNHLYSMNLLIKTLANTNATPVKSRPNQLIMEIANFHTVLLAETIREDGTQKQHLVDTIQRQVRQNEFRATLTPRSLAPDITETEAGSRFVQLIAKGVLAFCKNRKIPIPDTYEEFEEGLVCIARNEKVDGGIAFEDIEAMGDIFEFTGLESKIAHDAPHAGLELFKRTDDMDLGFSQKIELIKLLGSNPYILSMQERGHWIREWGGEKFEGIAKAFEYQDCQRRLVFKAMRRIVDVN